PGVVGGPLGVEARVVVVLAPLPDVAGQVEHAVGRGAVGEGADGGGGAPVLAVVGAGGPGLGAAPGVLPPVRAAGGLLPLGLAGEALARPGGVGAGVVP